MHFIKPLNPACGIKWWGGEDEVDGTNEGSGYLNVAANDNLYFSAGEIPRHTRTEIIN